MNCKYKRPTTERAKRAALKRAFISTQSEIKALLKITQNLRRQKHERTQKGVK